MAKDPRSDTLCPLCKWNVALEEEKSERFCFRCFRCDTQFDIIKVTDTHPQRMGPFMTMGEAKAAKAAAEYVLGAWGNKEMSIGDTFQIGCKWFIEFTDENSDERVIKP